MKDMAPQMFVWWGVGGKFVPPRPPPLTNVCNFSTLRSCIFISFELITFKFGNFINFIALFSVVSTDFSERVHVKILVGKNWADELMEDN